MFYFVEENALAFSRKVLPCLKAFEGNSEGTTTLSIMSIMRLRIKALYVALSITDTQHNNALHYAECRSAECLVFVGNARSLP